jgi:uncharacterized Tic20 family protein
MENLNSYLGREEVPLFAPTGEEKTMALLAHVLTFAAGFIAPLIVYLVKKDESAYVTAHAKESLNFQITVLIAVIVCFISIIGIAFVWIVGILDLIFVIIATIKASEGKLYKYPATIRLIK